MNNAMTNSQPILRRERLCRLQAFRQQKINAVGMARDPVDNQKRAREHEADENRQQDIDGLLDAAQVERHQHHEENIAAQSLSGSHAAGRKLNIVSAPAAIEIAIVST